MKSLILILLISLLSACGSAPRHTNSHTTSASDDQINDLLMYTLSLSDTAYRYGGSSPKTGFDCSGLVGHVFKHSLGIKLPRTTKGLSHAGKYVKRSRLQAGDLVFFNTQHRAYSHVGIYIGDGKFIHAPKTGSRIRVEKMKVRYWSKRYSGARRITS